MQSLAYTGKIFWWWVVILSVGWIFNSLLFKKNLWLFFTLITWKNRLSWTLWDNFLGVLMCTPTRKWCHIKLIAMHT